MKVSTFTVAASVFGLVAGGALPALAATVGYSLGDNGKTLVKMADLSMPANVTGVGLSDGVSLDGLAYRPNTRQLYGFSQNNGTVYTVDTTTGQVSSVATIPAGDPGVVVGEAGFDFNNEVDAARIVSTADDNLVFDPKPTPETISRANTLRYNDGDENQPENPSIFANAYTNQVPNAASTLQYVLDSELDILATLDNNAGTINTIGQITVDGSTPVDMIDNVDFSSTGGFDIFTSLLGVNTGYALLTTVNGEGLYKFDSFDIGSSGFVEATFLGRVGTQFGLLDGLAVYDEVPPIPVPASALLLGGAMAGFGALRRRKKAA